MITKALLQFPVIVESTRHAIAKVFTSLNFIKPNDDVLQAKWQEFNQPVLIQNIDKQQPVITQHIHVVQTLLASHDTDIDRLWQHSCSSIPSKERQGFLIDK